MRFIFLMVACSVAHYVCWGQRVNDDWTRIVERYRDTTRKYTLHADIKTYVPSGASTASNTVAFDITFTGTEGYYLTMHGQEIIVTRELSLIVDTADETIALAPNGANASSALPFLTDSVFKHFTVQEKTTDSPLRAIELIAKDKSDQRFVLWYDSDYLIRKYSQLYYHVDESTFKMTLAEAIGEYTYTKLDDTKDDPRWHVDYFVEKNSKGEYALTRRYKTYSLTILTNPGSK